jgi:hypothetical protein
MSNLRRLGSIIFLASLAGLICPALAQQPYRISDKEMKSLLERIEKEADRFREALKQGLKNSRLDLGRGEENIHQFVADLEVATDRLKDRFNGNRSVAADVEEVLRRAAYVDQFMQRHPLVTRADREWSALRRDLDLLAQAYQVSWQWDGPSARPARLSDREVKALLERIERGADRYRESMKKALKESRAIDRQARDNINRTLEDFAKAADRLKDHFGGNQPIAGEVAEVWRWAGTIDSFMRQYRLTDRAQRDWASLQREIEELARTYNVS